MLSIKIICVGKLKEKFYTEAAAEYQKRLGGLCRLEVEELPEARLPAEPSTAELEAALHREAESIFLRIPVGAVTVALQAAAAAGSMQAGSTPELVISDPGGDVLIEPVWILRERSALAWTAGN